MRTDREAADLARKVANAFDRPNRQMQDKISEIRGMIGDVLALKEDHRVKLCNYISDLLIRNDKTREGMTGFLVGGLYDLYENPLVEGSLLFEYFPSLKKMFSTDPVEVLKKIIAETSDKE